MRLANQPIRSTFFCFWFMVVAGGTATAPASPATRLADLVPQSPASFDAAAVEQLGELAEQVEAWATDKLWQQPPPPDQVLGIVNQVLDAKETVDQQLEQMFETRTQFASLPDDQARRDAIRSYLRCTQQLIDLSGRLQYFKRDLFNAAAVALDPYPAQYSELLDISIDRKVPVAADVFAYILFDPPPDSGFFPFPPEMRVKALRLMEVTRQPHILSELAEFFEQPSTTPEQALMAVQVVRATGLPQEPHPDQSRDLPQPPLTAHTVRDVLSRIEPELDRDEHRRLHGELTAWVEQRMSEGVREDRYRIGDIEVKHGDWFLMRNPSPYNLFTDLSPGLFTHVGVVVAETSDDGKRRFVITDLPERGDRIPVTNVETYLLRTVNYVFLRHHDPEVRQQLGDAAAAMIGNETEFDLTFQTQRVYEIASRPLGDQPINTYCAGFLLLTALQTDRSPEEFFPIPEQPAGGNCLKNLDKLGLSIGDDFVSPTGALFSPHFEISGRRKPLYTPVREIREAVYDFFAQCMIERDLQQSPDLRQALRTHVAALAEENPLLRQLLARTANVGQNMDLLSAARAAAVIETLDAIADFNADEFEETRAAFMAGPLDQLYQTGMDPQQIQQIQVRRVAHAPLFNRWVAGQLSPRQLRIELVDYYVQQGRTQLEQRFFSGGGNASP